MCDTQVLIRGGVTWFAKNSDREPAEPQPVVRIPAVRGDPATRLRTTYLEIEQVPDRHAVILSRPSWIWGAEIGANDRGVVIGNEAIFSRVMDRTPALLGMDLVRLGLERGATAGEALEVVTALLERHGQGGPAGYRDKSFCYDNSFLIADAAEAWVLETAERHWVARRVRDFAAISNCLTLGADYDRASEGLEEFARARGVWSGKGPLNFARAFDSRWMPFFARAHRRVEASRRWLIESGEHGGSVGRMAKSLRQHAGDGEDPLSGGNADLCMHAAGPVRRSQTTGSMISRLAPRDARHLVTGTSAPCLSLFRPVSFDEKVSFSVLSDPGGAPEDTLWWRYEAVHRRALFDANFRRRLRRDRDESERPILGLFEGERPSADRYREADETARSFERRQLEAAGDVQFRPPLTPSGLFWRRLDRADGIRALSPRSR